MKSNSKPQLTVDIEKREIVITHVFDAPRELVYKIYTDPNLLPQWWGPSILTTTVEKMDLRPGGKWRFSQRDPDGNVYNFHGEYREVKAPERLVYTFEFEGMPGNVMLETVVFEDLGEKTRVIAVDSFDTVEALQGMVQSGMEEGTIESFARFEKLLQAAMNQTKA
jgi:uncharacterized protein YndB with AHSA1/START domain